MKKKAVAANNAVYRSNGNTGYKNCSSLVIDNVILFILFEKKSKFRSINEKEIPK